MKERKWFGPIKNQGLGAAARRSHGMSGTRTYRSWISMMQRCTNPNDGRYSSYGGRGISVCSSWMEFETFLSDMGERPEGKSLDRYPDVNGNYEPGNCRWASPKEQGRNRRNNRVIEFNGRTETLAAWAELIGVPRETLLSRLDRGWSLDRALSLSTGQGMGATALTARSASEPEGV